MYTDAEIKHRDPYKPLDPRRLTPAQKQMILDKIYRRHYRIYDRLAEI